MFQPSGAQHTPAEAEEAGRKPKAAPPAPEVNPHLRAGAKLAQARELKGLSLDEIAKAIHVRRDYLEALEAMNVKLLPGKAYALAFLKSYAKAIGLNPEEIARQFQNESALTREDALPQIRNPKSKPGRERPWLGALAIAFAVSGFLGWRAWEETRHGDPRLQTAAQSAAPAAAQPSESPPADIAPAAVIEIKALQPAWLEVRGPDGTIFLSRTLQAGDRYRPEIGAGWTLHAKDGGAFEVAIDGVSVGLLGQANAPVLGRRVDTLQSSAALIAPKPAPAPAAKKSAPQVVGAAPEPGPQLADGGAAAEAPGF